MDWYFLQVYWLSVDYLVVAKSAIVSTFFIPCSCIPVSEASIPVISIFSFSLLLHFQDCGSYFTAFLYVEHWCEEHFNGLTLGRPDFSHHETVCSPVTF